MNYKPEVKQDRSKCRELQEVRAEIRSVIRTKREQLQRRYDSLKRQAGVADALSFLPGNMGNAVGASGTGAAVQMAIIDSEIKEKVRDLQQLEGRNDRLNQERRRLDASLSEISARMKRLNCS